MKYILAILWLLAAPATWAQQVPYRFSPLPLDARTHAVTYTDTLTAPGATAGQLLARLETWTSAQPNQIRNQRIDAAAGTASARVVLRRGLEQVAGRLTVRVYDRSYSYQLTGITYTQPGYARAGKHSVAQETRRVESLVYTRPGPYRTRKLAELDKQLQQLLSSLRRAMQASDPDAVSQL